jgi:hypothetical protein
MNEWILFTIGLLIGSISGIMTILILSIRRYNNMDSEIQDLRTQRRLLKDELLKRESRKPTPRKHRRNVSKRKHNV